MLKRCFDVRGCGTPRATDAPLTPVCGAEVAETAVQNYLHARAGFEGGETLSITNAPPDTVSML